MIVTNQDRDKTYKVNRVFYKARYYQGMLFGFNVYGCILCFKHLLGTYDTWDDARQICGEIRNFDRYTMPEPSLEVEDYEIT